MNSKPEFIAEIAADYADPTAVDALVKQLEDCEEELMWKKNEEDDQYQTPTELDTPGQVDLEDIIVDDEEDWTVAEDEPLLLKSKVNGKPQTPNSPESLRSSSQKSNSSAINKLNNIFSMKSHPDEIQKPKLEKPKIFPAQKQKGSQKGITIKNRGSIVMNFY
jgi:hypothetical protein